MCGRFAMDDETNELIEEFVLDGNDFREWRPAYSIAPTEVVPIIRERVHSDGEVTRTVERAEWNFRPGWLKGPQKRPQFNARIETISTLGLWKSAFAGSRCIVPMRGYYEWTERDGLKIPHFLHGDRTLAAAGLYAVRKEGDDWVLSTTIVTREARDASGEVHDRMPAFLQPEAYDAWLSPQKLDDDAQKQELLSMLTEVSGDVAATITQYEVDRRVNNSRTVDPADESLIQPVA